MTIYVETATLKYKPEAIGTINPKTGRVTKTEGAEETLSISIEQRQVSAAVYSQGGRDIAGTLIAGRLLPIGSVFPDWYRNGLDCDIELTDGSIAKFYVLLKTPSRFGLEQVFGQRVTGYIYQPDN